MTNRDGMGLEQHRAAEIEPHARAQGVEPGKACPTCGKEFVAPDEDQVGSIPTASPPGVASKGFAGSTPAGAPTPASETGGLAMRVAMALCGSRSGDTEEIAWAHAKARGETEQYLRDGHTAISVFQEWQAEAAARIDSVWRPTDTAPRDGTLILFSRDPPYSASDICIGFWHFGQNVPGFVGSDGFGVILPSVWKWWQPLPNFPDGSRLDNLRTSLASSERASDGEVVGELVKALEDARDTLFALCATAGCNDAHLMMIESSMKMANDALAKAVKPRTQEPEHG